MRDQGVSPKSNRLAGKHIALGVTGGIGAVETVRLARELRRHGAEITAFLSPEALRFVTRLSLEWATQGEVIDDTLARVDHLAQFDLVLIAPLTLNTLSKAALGIADQPVTLLIAGQLARKIPIVFVPTMNEALLGHPLYEPYARRLGEWGVKFYPSPHDEGRLKMPDPERLVSWVIEEVPWSSR